MSTIIMNESIYTIAEDCRVVINTRFYGNFTRGIQHKRRVYLKKFPRYFMLEHIEISGDILGRRNNIKPSEMKKRNLYYYSGNYFLNFV